MEAQASRSCVLNPTETDVKSVNRKDRKENPRRMRRKEQNRQLGAQSDGMVLHERDARAYITRPHQRI